MPEIDDAPQPERRRAWLPPDEEVFRMVIREEVRAGMTEFAANPRCPRPCAQIAALEVVVFGRDEDDTPGLAERLRGLESFAGKASRVVWLAIGAIVSSGVAVLVAAYLATHPEGK